MNYEFSENKKGRRKEERVGGREREREDTTP